ncbi:MAG: hypothetical protein HUU22_03105 [Phycisphaerae bacterium]|nr:hypothetical protein [Phycisphaerae bacterium]NUQ45003.1 hypothetical protein [Phycisphaerae bacterium]
MPATWLFISLLALYGTQDTPPEVPASEPATQDAGSTERKLDQPIAQWAIEERPLTEVLDALGKVADINIRLDPLAIERLPWGAQTKLANLSVSDATPREILSKTLGELGLEYSVQGSDVWVEPMPVIERLDGRASWKTLGLLKNLMTTSYSAEAFSKFALQFRITSKVDAPAMLTEQLARAGRGMMAELLETATASLGWTWFPQEDHIVVLTREAAIARAMSRRMNGRYVKQPLGEILFALGKEAGVHVHLQAGMFKKLSPQTVERYSLFLTNVSIRQAFDFIAADTGVAYRIRTDGVHVGLAEDIGKLDSAETQTAPTDDPYVAKLSVPIANGQGTYEFLIRESELPADVRAIRRRIRQRFIDDVRRANPASQPAATQAAPSGEPPKQP